MSVFNFGGIFNIIIIIAIAKAVYKHAIKGKSTTLDQSINKFIDTVKTEMNGTKTTTKNQTYNQSAKDIIPLEIKEDEFTSVPSEKYDNADELLRAGLITKAEYRKIKK